MVRHLYLAHRISSQAGASSEVPDRLDGAGQGTRWDLDLRGGPCRHCIDTLRLSLWPSSPLVDHAPLDRDHRRVVARREGRRWRAAGAPGGKVNHLPEAVGGRSHGGRRASGRADRGTSVIGAAKVDRLLKLARRAKLTTVVDSLAGAEPIARAFASSGMTIDVLLEIDIGYHRCGVDGRGAPALARRLSQLPGLNLVGVMGYEGHLYDLSGKGAVEAAARESYEMLTRVANGLRNAGIEVPRVSIGASAGARAAVDVRGITEVRAGSYLFNHRAQVK